MANYHTESMRLHSPSSEFQILLTADPCVSLASVSWFHCLFLSFFDMLFFYNSKAKEGWSMFCNYACSVSIAHSISVASEHLKTQ